MIPVGSWANNDVHHLERAKVLPELAMQFVWIVQLCLDLVNTGGAVEHDAVRYSVADAKFVKKRGIGGSMSTDKDLTGKEILVDVFAAIVRCQVLVGAFDHLTVCRGSWGETGTEAFDKKVDTPSGRPGEDWPEGRSGE
jgi:hypothetical protein